jgi:oxalate decarboxylase
VQSVVAGGHIQVLPCCHSCPAKSRLNISFNMVMQVLASDGSYVNKADVAVFPVSTRMSGALVYLAPGSMRQLHWHLNIDEWQYVLNGSVEAGVFLRPGSSFDGQLGPGDVGFAPRGSAHYLRNPTTEPAFVVLVFNDGKFTDIELPNFLGTVPSAWTAASLNTSAQVVSSIDYSRAGFALPMPAPSKQRPPRSSAAAPLPVAHR